LFVMDEEVKVFLAKNHQEWNVLENGKVKCVVSGHEMKADIKLIKEHLKGKRYRNGVRKNESSKHDFSQYEPYVTDHRSRPALLYCLLTKRNLPRDIQVVSKHVSGRRFRILRAEFEAKEQKRKEREARRAAGEDVGEEDIDVLEEELLAHSDDDDAGSDGDDFEHADVDDDDIDETGDANSEDGDDDDDSIDSVDEDGDVAHDDSNDNNNRNKRPQQQQQHKNPHQQLQKQQKQPQQQKQQQKPNNNKGKQCTLEDNANKKPTTAKKIAPNDATVHNKGTGADEGSNNTKGGKKPRNHQ